jgi:hypothetical protein
MVRLLVDGIFEPFEHLALAVMMKRVCMERIMGCRAMDEKRVIFLRIIDFFETCCSKGMVSFCTTFVSKKWHAYALATSILPRPLIFERAMSINASEARLGELTRKTFLSMWAYQNPYFAKAKELCDVLVVFGDHVIIMSDKLIDFDNEAAPDVGWQRWYRKAVAGSVRQLRGALRRIRTAPGQIYSDPQASSPFPLRLPSADDMKVHLVAVANGSEQSNIRRYGRACLSIDTHDVDGKRAMTVGTHYPEFVHVVSKGALEAMFACFDTTRDFIDYLERKQEALSSTPYLIHGEEELVGAYMLSQSGNRPFRIPTGSFPIYNGVHTVDQGIWAAYLHSDELERRTAARKPSYIIDRLIEHVAEEYKSESLVVGQDQALATHEAAFRLIAAESRLGRQLVSAALHEIIDEDADTFWSTVTESPDVPGLLYVWLVYPRIPSEVPTPELESALQIVLAQYMLVAQAKFPKAQRLFGVCMPNRESDRTSIVFHVSDGTIWTPEMAALAEKYEKQEGILAQIETSVHFSSR